MAPGPGRVRRSARSATVRITRPITATAPIRYRRHCRDTERALHRSERWGPKQVAAERAVRSGHAPASESCRTPSRGAIGLGSGRPRESAERLFGTRLRKDRADIHLDDKTLTRTAGSSPSPRVDATDNHPH
jgi:hypothetical protein